MRRNDGSGDSGSRMIVEGDAVEAYSWAAPMLEFYLSLAHHIFSQKLHQSSTSRTVQISNMKLSILATLIASAAAFAPAPQGPQTTALNMDRKAFIAAAGASIFAAVPLVANAGTMGQERVTDPTEV